MATNGELNVRLEFVEKELAREIEKREKAVKYMNNMLEDIQTRYADIQRQMGNIEAAITQHFSDDKLMTASIKALDERLRHVESMVWVAFGGVIVIGGIITIAVRFLK